MKLKTLTLTTSAIFGAAMLSYAQVETERSRSATEGGNNTQETTRDNQGDQPDAATERQRREAQAAAERARQDGEMERSSTRPGDATTTPRVPPGTSTDRPDGAGREPTQSREGLGTQRDLHDPDWRGSQHEEMELSQISAALQKGLRDAASGGKLDDEVTRIRFGDKELYRGKADIDGAEDLYIYVDGNGKLVKTQQEVELENVPQAVRTAANSEDSGNGRVDRVLLEMADGKTTYIIQVDGDNDRQRWIQLDEAGKVLKTHEQQDD
jgi:uncharacterized membrane protein YkoI